jgi:glycerol uptake facilitator-like aquaporin
VLGGITTRDSLAYIGAQVLGGCLGTVAANLMFELGAINVSTHARSSGALWFSEVIATMGLLLVILGVVRSGKAHMAPFAVGGYIAAAYWFTSSTSFANPTVTIARTLSDTFAGIKPSSVPPFIVAQLIGAAIAVIVARFLHPDLSGDADAVVVPHDQPDT